jgi:NO-binding membrane sensor protein with MHYT domain
MAMSEATTRDANPGPLDTLYEVQTDPKRRWVATVTAVIVGLALASLHWSGLLVGGALVGFTWPTLRRALVAGVGFGVVALVVFVARLALAGTLDAFLAMGAITAIAVVVPLACGLLGGLARGLVRDAPLERAD